MLKKLIILILVLISTITLSYAEAPSVNCIWLPWCVDSNASSPSPAWNLSNNIAWKFIWSAISELIQYVAVLAVIALMISWIMYLVSWWEEEKTKKAKSWITYSLIWVFLSISAFGIIQILNNLQI
jgi:heme A synthase